MDPTRRRISIVLLTVLGVLLARQCWHSAVEILEVNDFEVFHHIGEVAAGDARGTIYEVVSPVKKRGPFLYPPSAAVLLVPLSWLPHDAAGIVFTVIKMASLVLLLWGSVRFSGAPPRDSLGLLIAATTAAVLLFRPIDSDIGNGQINFIIAAAAVGGVWLMMPMRWWWAGALLLACAIAIKLTPVLLLAVPLLHRRWKALGACAGWVVVLMIMLPGVWFGWSTLGELLEQHRDASTGFTLTWTSDNGQSTPTEFVQFVLAHQDESPFVAWSDVPIVEEDDEHEAGWASQPLNSRGETIARRVWLAFGLIGGAGYLLVRGGLYRRRPADWTWDVAMLCALIVLLSPRVQKAHLVILIVPMSWIICRLLAIFVQRGFHRTLRQHWLLLISVVVLGFLLLVSNDLAVPTFGLTTEPARPAMLVGLLVMIGQIIRLGRADVAPRTPMSPAGPLGGMVGNRARRDESLEAAPPRADVESC